MTVGSHQLYFLLYYFIQVISLNIIGLLAVLSGTPSLTYSVCDVSKITFKRLPLCCDYHLVRMLWGRLTKTMALFFSHAYDYYSNRNKDLCTKQDIMSSIARETKLACTSVV